MARTRDIDIGVGVRAHPKHLINPFVQFYWMPTRQNWEYHKNVTLVNGLMGCQQLQEKQQHRIQQSNSHNGGGDGDDDEGEDNMITMTLRSVIEQYYQEKDQNQQQHLNSSVTSSSCPFTSSSRSSFSSFTTDLVDIPTPNHYNRLNYVFYVININR
jgi:hypothetical protein